MDLRVKELLPEYSYFWSTIKYYSKQNDFELQLNNFYFLLYKLF